MRPSAGQRRRMVRVGAGVVVLAGLGLGGGTLGAVLGAVVLAAAAATRAPTALALGQLAVGVTFEPAVSPALLVAEAGVVGLLVAPPVRSRWNGRTVLVTLLLAGGLAGLAVLPAGPLWVRAGAIVAAAVATGWVARRADGLASATGSGVRDREGAEDVA